MTLTSLMLAAAIATGTQSPAPTPGSPTSTETKKPSAPPLVHSRIGESVSTADKSLTITTHAKLQNYDWSATDGTRDPDINSPKSINIHPSGRKFYVNSLEGASTVVYDAATLRKIKTISHRITSAHRNLWVTDDFYKFNHTYPNPRTFTGKPVESAFTHDGRYLWVPYYRRSFDINAQDPSAIAVIDTATDSIVRLMDAGVLPKMIAASPDGRHIYAAGNTVSRLYVVDTGTMKAIASIPVDSYPVGLDISADGRRVYTTSQGRARQGGNAVDIFRVDIKATAR